MEYDQNRFWYMTSALEYGTRQVYRIMDYSRCSKRLWRLCAWLILDYIRCGMIRRIVFAVHSQRYISLFPAAGASKKKGIIFTSFLLLIMENFRPRRDLVTIVMSNGTGYDMHYSMNSKVDGLRASQGTVKHVFAPLLCIWWQLYRTSCKWKTY